MHRKPVKFAPPEFFRYSNNILVIYKNRVFKCKHDNVSAKKEIKSLCNKGIVWICNVHKGEVYINKAGKLNCSNSYYKNTWVLEKTNLSAIISATTTRFGNKILALTSKKQIVLFDYKIHALNCGGGFGEAYDPGLKDYSVPLRHSYKCYISSFKHNLPSYEQGVAIYSNFDSCSFLLTKLGNVYVSYNDLCDQECVQLKFKLALINKRIVDVVMNESVPAYPYACLLDEFGSVYFCTIDKKYATRKIEKIRQGLENYVVVKIVLLTYGVFCLTDNGEVFIKICITGDTLVNNTIEKLKKSGRYELISTYNSVFKLKLTRKVVNICGDGDCRYVVLDNGETRVHTYFYGLKPGPNFSKEGPFKMVEPRKTSSIRLKKKLLWQQKEKKFPKSGLNIYLK